jgi:hypothetical protein
VTAAPHRPSLAFVEALRRRILPAHRLVSWRLDVMRGAAAVLAVICPLTLAGIIAVLAMADAPRQLALDTLASLGLGVPRPEARLAGISCSYHRGTGRMALNEHRCTLRLQDGRDSLRLDLRAGDPPDRTDAGPVVTVLGQPAIPWSAAVMWSRWVQMLPLAVPFVLLVPLGVAGIGAWRSLTRRIRAIRDGEPRPADLLCRRAGKDAKGPATWHVAFDHAGTRRIRRIEAPALPVLLDREATRGVVLAAPDGSLDLLQDGGWPLALDAETARWLAERTEAMRQPRALPPPDILASLPTTEERDYAMAFEDLARAETSAEFRPAFDVLQAAAARLGPARVDALLQRLRPSAPA